MNKEEILQEIKRIAAENNGKAPGKQQFFAKTGIKESEWYPHLWLRWSDAINEAGFKPNAFVVAYDSGFLIEKYIELIRELGHFPIAGELKVKSKVDKDFPSHSTFSQLGLKQERIDRIIKYCNSKSEFNDIVLICLEEQKKYDKSSFDVEESNSTKVGYVYLIKHGSRNEYKIGKTNNPLRREGEIRLELPEKVQPIHYIETDDPSGIENYWHNRFSNKRKEGEWFSLTKDDVQSFKKWKRIY